MFDINVSDEQINYADETVNNYNFGQRGRGDGTREQQRTGIIGQTVFADLISAARPNGAEGFDGGKDFIINGKRVDIKTMGRTVPVLDHYVHNFVGYQKPYDVDYYIFASFNKKRNILTICGYIDKKQFFERADYLPAGSVRHRDDGSSFTTFAPLYEIKQSDLIQANSLEDILKGIK